MSAVDSQIIARAREAVKFVSRFGAVRAAYLFGSQIDGTADADSDIDIGVFVEGCETWDFDRRIHVCVEVQLQVGDDLELHLFSASSHDYPKPASFAQYVKKHGVPVAM